MRNYPVPTGNNENILDKYIDYLRLNGRKENTIMGTVWKVYTFLKFYDNKDADRITNTDIEKYILHRRKNNKPATVHNDIIAIRSFYKWLKPENGFFENIRTRNPKNNLPVDELVVQDDVKELLAACNKQRDRAIVMLLWDSAVRISEGVGLNVGNVQFDKYGAVVIVQGKTGMRRIRLIDSVPDLQLWINQHPQRDDHNAPLFITDRKYNGKYKRLDNHTINNMLLGTAERAGIKKRVHPHALRHGRLTELSKQGFSEMELRIFAGWTKESNMPATYIHLSGGDLENKILASRGIIEDKNKAKQEELKPIECPRCKTRNPYDSKFCSQCSLILDQKLAETLDNSTKPIENSLTQLMESKINELVEARINEMLHQIKI
ncbi:MAG: tyrosine-type recombinase/integrase [Methanosarcinaceae archaeon]|nr:tyrosine-type recombinase/integrase [Methanosarcinaceae archaeon]